MLDQRGQLLRAAVGFAGCALPLYDRALRALRAWLDSWSGIGRVAVGMARQGYDLQLTRYDRAGLARDVLHNRDGALADEHDGHRMGAHAVARDAAGGVGGAGVGQQWLGKRQTGEAYFLGARAAGVRRGLCVTGDEDERYADRRRRAAAQLRPGRPRRRRVRCEHGLCAAGRQCHGVGRHRPGARRQMSGTAQTGRSGSQSSLSSGIQEAMVND